MTAAKPLILGFYGLGGPVWSEGVRDMIGDAVSAGFEDAFVLVHNVARTTGFTLASNWSGKIIILGHSMGATAAVDLAAKLVRAGREIDLLFTLDCHRPRKQLPGVKKHVDIWQPGRIFGVKKLYPVERTPGSGGQFLGIRAKENHTDLDNAKWVHDLFSQEICAVAKKRGDTAQNGAPGRMAASPAPEPAQQAGAAGSNGDPIPGWHEFQRAFFDRARREVFGGRLTAEQVRGMTSTLQLWFERHSDQPIQFLVYMLATTWWETGRRMVAVKERGGASYFRRMYDITGARPSVARRLGNVHPGDGALYCGRGKPQLTGRANYRKATQKIGFEFGVDFEAEPDRVLEDQYSDLIMFSGMLEGWFTGRSLTRYYKNGRLDTYNARRVVNGTDKAATIKRAYNRFWPCIEAGLKAAANAPRGAAPVEEPKKPSEKPTQTGEKPMNPLSGIDGYKTYISLALLAGVAFAEGVLGWDIQGVDLTDNWAEVVLGTGAAGGFRSAITKLVVALKGE